jgi:hypothetical protein
MKILLKILKLGLLIGFSTACSSNTLAQGASGTDIPIIVMADDEDDTAIRSNSSVSKLMNTKIKEQFSRYQYYVVDQNAVAAHQGFNFSQRMSTAQVLQAAMLAKQSGQPEFDVRAVVIYRAYGTIQNLGFAKKVNLEVGGEVHDADAKRYIGDFGPKSITFPAPADCDDKVCVERVAREKAKDIASVVADEARKKLAILTKGSASASASGGASAGASDAPGLVTTFKMRFENFTMPQVLKFKSVMESEFPGFSRSGKLSGSEPIIEFGYISTAAQDKLVEWLYVLNEDLGHKNVKISAEGTSFVIQFLGADVQAAPPRKAGRFN